MMQDPRSPRQAFVRAGSHRSFAPSETTRSQNSWETETNVKYDYSDWTSAVVEEESVKDLPAHMIETERHILLKNLEQEENEMIRALRHAHNLHRRCRMPNTSKEHERFHLYVEEQDFVQLNNEVRRHRFLKAWFFFDSFFGMLVLVNGALFGLTVNGNIDEDKDWVLIVQSLFVIAFTIEWCVRWFYHPKQLSGMLQDPWMVFDLIVLAVSMIDVWVLRATLGDSRQVNIKIIQVLRILRLLRLIRLIRLLKLLQDLWVLVRGMGKVAAIFHWAVLALMLIIYSYALIMCALIGRAERMEDSPSVQLLWGTVPRSMLSLAEMSTFSGARRILLADIPNDVLKAFYCAMLLSFLSFSTFGISNLIVGVMLTATVSVEVQTLHFEDSLGRLKRHDEGLQLRHQLLEECRKLGITTSMGSPHLSKAHLLKLQTGPTLIAREADSNVALLTSISGFLGQSGAVKSMFELSGIGQQEIEEIFAVYASVLGPAAAATISVDDFIDGCLTLTGRVHQMDVHTMLCGFNAVQEQFKHMLNCLKDAEQSLQKTSNAVRHHLEVHHSSKDGFLTPREHLTRPTKASRAAGHASAPVVHDDAVFDREAEQILAASDVEARVQQVYLRFDLVFCVVICGNAILVAYEIARLEHLNDIGAIESVFQSESSIWLIGEMFFLAIFGMELILRIILHYQVTSRGDLMMYWKIFPRALWTHEPVRLARAALNTLPELMRDPSYVLEVVIWVISAVDVLVLTWVLSGNREFGSWLMPIKVARLVRLLRMTRLILLVPELNIIITGVRLSGPMLFWAIVMLLVTCYAFAVIMVVSVGQAEEMKDVVEIQHDWGQLDHAMMVLLRLCTFSDWGRHFELVAEHYWWAPVILGIFTVFAGFSMINMVTGVMVRSTFRAVGVNVKNKEHKVLLEARQALLLTRDVLADSRGSGQEKKQRSAVPKGRGRYLKDTFAKLARRTTDPSATSAKQRMLNAALMKDTISATEMHALLENKRFYTQLMRAEIRPDEVIILYSRTKAACGQVTIKDFIDGLMRIKQPVASTDVAQAKSILRRTVADVKAFSDEASSCQDYLMDITGRLHKAHLYQSQDIPDPDTMLQEEVQSQKELRNRVVTITKQNQRQRKHNERLRRFLHRHWPTEADRRHSTLTRPLSVMSDISLSSSDDDGHED